MERQPLTGGGRAGQQRRLLLGDLVGGLRLLVLVQLLHLVAVLDRILDELLDVVQVGVADRLQLNRRQVEVILDAVLDPHGHHRVQAELDQRHLPGQVLGFIPHRHRHDTGQPIMNGLTGIR